MEAIINWQLYSDDELIIDLKEVPALYKENDYLEFKDNETNNRIDLINNRYERITKEYKMNIDFNDNICYFILPNEEPLGVKIDGSIINNNKEIIIEYSYGESKKIIIKIKD